MEIYVNRLLRERGTIMGTLKVVKEVAGEGIELVKVCGTVEREADCLPAGKYRVRIGKCKRLNRKMPYLVPVDDASAKSVAMIQPGNGPFTMSRGSILVGEVHAPGFVLKSQPLFTTLYERIKKAVWRGNEVTLEIKEV